MTEVALTGVDRWASVMPAIGLRDRADQIERAGREGA